MRSSILQIVCLALALSAPAAALDLGLPPLTKEQKVKAVNVGGMAFITAWGVAKWDYFKRSPNAQAEGWFGRGTDEGGADKFGHLWSAYAMADGLAGVYEGWGFDEDAAAFNGALSSFAIMGYMELGDSFSRYGFSYEDMVMTTVGSLASWYLYKYPSLAEKLDLRWEYAPAFDEPDFFTDYEHSKYLVALELDPGWATLGLEFVVDLIDAGLEVAQLVGAAKVVVRVRTHQVGDDQLARGRIVRLACLVRHDWKASVIRDRRPNSTESALPIR